MGQIGAAAGRARDSDSLDVAIRVGLVAYGVVYLLVGWLALQVAFGEQQRNASSTGAMKTLAGQPLGAAALWVVAAGLLALVAWRLLEVRSVWVADDGTDRLKGLASNAGKAVIYVVLAFSAARTAMGDSGGGGGTDSITARVLDLPGGVLLVGAVALGILAYAGWQVWKGWTEKFLEELGGGRRGRKASTAYRWLGKVGHVARGVAFGVIGVLLGWAAITHDADKSVGLDGALQELAQQPFGRIILTVVALGIASYGLFAFAQARHPPS